MKLMLDTNICIYIIKQKPINVIKRFKQYAIGDIGLSSITLAELQYGVSKSRHVKKNRLALNEFLLPLEIVAFDEKAAEVYGNVRAHLESIGKPIGSLDTMIGAHALSLGVTLVTNNKTEFSCINGLEFVDWTD